MPENNLNRNNILALPESLSDITGLKELYMAGAGQMTDVIKIVLLILTSEIKKILASYFVEAQRPISHLLY